MSAPFAAIAGAVIAAAIYLVARQMGVSMRVPVDPRDGGSAMVPLGLVGVVLSSVFPAFIGAIALALLTRTSRPVTAFLALAAAFVAGSAGPLLWGGDPGMARMDGATRGTLALMHVLRMMAVAWILVRALRAQPNAPAAGRAG
jgi:hypothetical protein